MKRFNIQCDYITRESTSFKQIYAPNIDAALEIGEAMFKDKFTDKCELQEVHATPITEEDENDK